MMHPDIDRWVRGVVEDTQDGSVSEQYRASFSEKLDFVFSQMDGLCLAARGMNERVAIRYGLQRLNVSPLIYIAHMAKHASEQADSVLHSDPRRYSYYACIANYALVLINAEANRLSETYGLADAVSKAGLNELFVHSDHSLNIVDTLNQTKTLFSLPVFANSACDRVTCQRYFDGLPGLQVEQHSELLSAKDIALSVSGVNSELLNLAMSIPLIDYAQYRQNSYDSGNKPYMHRIACSDFGGASFMLYQLTADLPFQEKCSAATEYVMTLYGMQNAFPDVASAFISQLVGAQNLLQPPGTFGYWLNPQRAQSADIDDFDSILGHAYSYPSALGISPFAGLAFGAHASGSNEQPYVTKTFETHCRLSEVYRVQLLHSQESLAEAQSDLSSMLNSQIRL